MYLRHTIRKKNGKVHRYWCLVRSVRVGRRVIQQTVAQLGELDERGRVAARTLARRLVGAPEQAQLFKDGSEDLTVPVRLKGIRIERSRQFGDVYLALALWRGMGLEDLCERLFPAGKERVAWAKTAAVLGAVERTAHCRGLVSPHGALRSAAAQRRGGQQGSTVSQSRSSADAKISARDAFVAALRQAVCSPERSAALRCPEHLFRGRGGSQPAGTARLFPRPSPRLQAGLHRPRRDLRRLSARLRGVRRQYP